MANINVTILMDFILLSFGNERTVEPIEDPCTVICINIT